MKNKRLLAAIAIAAAIPLSLAACSSTAPATPAKHIKLTVEDYYVGPTAPVYNKIYEACAAAGGTQSPLVTSLGRI